MYMRENSKDTKGSWSEKKVSFLETTIFTNFCEFFPRYPYTHTPHIRASTYILIFNATNAGIPHTVLHLFSFHLVIYPGDCSTSVQREPLRLLNVR